MTPQTGPDLTWVGWAPDDIMTAAVGALAAKEAALSAVYGVPAAERTFRNTIAPLQYADDAIADMQQSCDVLVSVHPDETIRDAAQRTADFIDERNVALDFDRRLWDAVQEWNARGEKLDVIDRKLADDLNRDLRRMGFGLSEEHFSQLKENIIRLRKMQTEFEKTINEWDDAIILPRERLGGLPERYIGGLKREGDDYRISLEYPDLMPFMRLADDEPARRELAEKNYRKGGEGNLQLLARMVALRHANARLLGYDSHAAFVIEPRMAKTPATADAFLRRVTRALTPASRGEMADLTALKRGTLGADDAPPVAFHETAYWSYKLLCKRYGIDGETVKEYFPSDHVTEAMLEMYQGVFGLTFRELRDAPSWHPSVRIFEVSDSTRTLGYFALDLFPRKGKYGHAASMPIRLGRTTADGDRVPGFLALVCNFPAPTEDSPSLLTHDEVETFLHEFGHIVHALVSGGRWQRQNGFAVQQDFVEMPSQLFEEWAWNPACLDRLTSHYRTGTPMPAELRDRVIGARHHMDASFYLRQASEALYDLTIHTAWQPDALTPDALASYYRELTEELTGIALPSSSLFPAGWGHMADYDAAYYGYLWSKVFALDLYSVFARDPLSRAVGKRYSAAVLEPGGSRREADMVREFLGREPSEQPFLRALDIAE